MFTNETVIHFAASAFQISARHHQINKQIKQMNKR